MPRTQNKTQGRPLLNEGGVTQEDGRGGRGVLRGSGVTTIFDGQVKDTQDACKPSMNDSQ